MIVRIRGLLTGVEKERALVEINGITYGILVSDAVAGHMVSSGTVGHEITLHTYSYIEGNPGLGNLTPRLVGFPEKADLEFFLLLTTVQGLGVKKALRALAIPVREVARAIELNDLATLKQLPEIGGKTAQKIVVELKGKAARFALLDEEGLKRAQSPGLEAEYQRDAVDILVQLQYNVSEADTLVRQTVRRHPDIATAEELIQQIFKQQTRPK